MYDDNYETCFETFITLRIYFDNMDSVELTEYLGIEPTEFQNQGEESSRGKVLKNGWFLSTKSKFESKDCRRHIDFITETILPIKSKLESIIAEGAKVDLSCYWKTKDGHGGPTLSEPQFSKLAEIGVDLWFDIY